MVPLNVRLGYDERKPHLTFEVTGFVHPDIAEPDGLDLLTCRVHANAPPVTAAFDVELLVRELLDLREYLAEINSGNGPPGTFAMAGGLLSLSFAPSRRGPVLCAVQLKSVDASHVRLEYLVTLEPESITRAIADLATLERETAE
ncbi:MAG TPA: hypothetical protein VGN11_03495 [Candidatus Baltobacteraceae bacterium]|jgi:hypothetical protein|nr:hypothetical protein [Candidatus Baltobacteraceae bacterium]